MSRLGWLLLTLYVSAAGAYGGWRGGDLFSDWWVAGLTIPALAAAALKVAREWRYNPHWSLIKIVLVITGVGAILLAVFVLGIAWVIAGTTKEWRTTPTVRALAGAGMVAAVIALQFAYRNAGKSNVQPDENDSENTASG
jgi:hypothetical protein